MENENMETDSAEDYMLESDLVHNYNDEDSFAENANVENDNLENDNMEADNAEDSFAISELNESVNDENYLADAEINDQSDLDDNDPTADCLKRKMYSLQKKQNLKKERETRSARLAYVSHRIHFSLRELFNARQFIKQAEESIRAQGGENLIAMERAREIYWNPRRVVTEEAINAGLAVTKDVDTKAAAEFDAEMHPPRYPDDSDSRDS
uniref:Uncharacterized protein n=1 Tax=Bactrocera dorsalis TaxID=27457 RepID=A0A034W9M4_BACDO